MSTSEEAKTRTRNSKHPNGKSMHGKSKAGNPRVAGLSTYEVPIMTLDVMNWRKRTISDDEVRTLLSHVADYVRARFDPGQVKARMNGPIQSLKGDPVLMPQPRMQMRAEGPDCVLEKVEFRECTDEQGQTHMCRCELYRCSDGTSFWQCTPV